MDHRYIDEHVVAERYLRHALTPEERPAFEAHLVDCSECTDRLLLVEMFHTRNGASHSVPQLSAATPEPAAEDPPESLPAHARFLAQFRPWQLALLLLAAAIVFAIPTLLFLWLIGR
jgi:anti-sigma factor RsiW